MTQLHYFIEQPYLGYSLEEAAKHGATTLTFSNSNFDPEKAARLYRRYHQEYVYAEEVGFDGIMLNEHHNTPGCMQASINITATVLAKITERVKILLAGNILPIWDDPLRLAEEIAMIDLMSGGRVISGFVRGTGVESLAHNVNTITNRERFDEAHDLIIKTWTTPGPFRWESKNFEYRVVNPWVLPLQKPHPRIIVPGVASMESVAWAARHGYPYFALATYLQDTDEVFALYDRVAREAGHEVTADNHGYLVRVHVAATEERAHEQARRLFGRREAQLTSQNHSQVSSKAKAYNAPPGYLTRASAGRYVRALNPYSYFTTDYEQAVNDYAIVVGAPDQVTERLQYLRERFNLGHLCIWHFPSEDAEVTRENIRLLGSEVLPALRATAPAREAVAPA